MLVALAKTKGQLKLSFCFCIAPLKKISAENPYGIRDFGVFNAFFATSARIKQNHRNSSVSQKRYHSFLKAICEPLYYGGQKVEFVHTVTHHVP